MLQKCNNNFFSLLQYTDDTDEDRPVGYAVVIGGEARVVVTVFGRNILEGKDGILDAIRVRLQHDVLVHNDFAFRLAFACIARPVNNRSISASKGSNDKSINTTHLDATGRSAPDSRKIRTASGKSRLPQCWPKAASWPRKVPLRRRNESRYKFAFTGVLRENLSSIEAESMMRKTYFSHQWTGILQL